MANFAALAGTIDDHYEKMEALEHSESERRHAIRFMKMAKKNNIELIINLQGIYWNSIHEKFLSYANKKDFISCLIIQEVMLESFAVSMYKDAGNALGGEIGQLLMRTSEEEKEHLIRATQILRKELMKDGNRFIKKFHNLHKECMTILAEWSSNIDVKGHWYMQRKRHEGRPGRNRIKHKTTQGWCS